MPRFHGSSVSGSIMRASKESSYEDGLEYNKKLSDVNYFQKNTFSSVDNSPELDTSM